MNTDISPTHPSHIIPLSLHPFGFSRRLEAGAYRVQAIEALPEVAQAKEVLSKRNKWLAVIHTLQDVVFTMSEENPERYQSEMIRLQNRIRKEASSPDGGWYAVVDSAFKAVVAACAANLAEMSPANA